MRSDVTSTGGRDLEIPLPTRRRLFTRFPDLPDTEHPPDPRGRRVRLAAPSAHVVVLISHAEQMPKGANEELTVAGLTAWYDVGEAILPELSREDVNRISAPDLFAAIALLRQPIEELERIAKNGNAPLAEAPKGSPSRTPSPTRSRGSRRPTASGSGT